MDRKPKALIVDDEKPYSETVREVLEDAGIQVYVADTAGAAETLFALLVPDLVVLAMRMPEMNALDLIERLRSYVGWGHMPIVVASGLGLKSDEDAALKAGANAYLAKPFTARELRDEVKRFLPLVRTGRLLPAA